MQVRTSFWYENSELLTRKAGKASFKARVMANCQVFSLIDTVGLGRSAGLQCRRADAIHLSPRRVCLGDVTVEADSRVALTCRTLVLCSSLRHFFAATPKDRSHKAQLRFGLAAPIRSSVLARLLWCVVAMQLNYCMQAASPASQARQRGRLVFCRKPLLSIFFTYE